MRKIFFEKKSQIWVESVVYTIIGLSIISIVLAVATPSINKYKDKMIIQQTITNLNSLNDKIIEVRDEGTSNKRVAEIAIKKGRLTIDSPEDKIRYVLEDSSLEYSEAGESINYSDMEIKTQKTGRKYNITLTFSYKNMNLTYDGKDKAKVLNPVSIPYKLFIVNNGTANGKTIINFQESS